MQASPKGPNQPKPKYAKSVGLPTEPGKGKSAQTQQSAQQLAKALKR